MTFQLLQRRRRETSTSALTTPIYKSIGKYPLISYSYLQFTHCLLRDQITDSQAGSKKRWFGSFDDWLKKMTTIVKDEAGSLPLDYDRTLKLFHAHKKCPHLHVDATFDIDAYIHLGLEAQYGSYLEGSILPKPSLIAAYGYFSIEPAAEVGPFRSFNAELLLILFLDPLDSSG